MRFRIELELKSERLPIDYRPSMISFMKHSLMDYEDGKHFDTYYKEQTDKPFTFSIGIPNSKFSKEIIVVPNKKINMIFSTNDVGTGIIFFNALSMQKNKSYPLAYENTMTIKNISVEREIAITKNRIEVMFKSPLCIREHIKESNKDTYYSYEKEGFNEMFNKVLESQISNSNFLPTSILEGFSIVPMNCKKTVVRHHEQFVEVTIGRVALTGNIALLNYLYTNGVGSRKSSGFGLIEIIREETV